MARSMRLGARSLAAFCGFIAFACPASADEMWIAPTLQQDLGGLGIASNIVWPVTAIGASRLAWGVPNDLQTFQNAKVVLIPHGAGGAATLNVIVCAAQNGQPVAGTCAGPSPHAFVGVANQLVEVDISADLAPKIGTAGLNHLAVVVYTTPTTTTDHVAGLRFVYNATLPAGVATLGANTFAGTQTAPMFIGDGTNVSNVNANLLDGLDSTAYATTVHTHNVSQIVNGARLAGGNTFTGSQVVDGGHLDLDSSTAATGVITKNGTRFLHDFGSGNTFLGLNAGNFVMTGQNNTAIGSGALPNATTGELNTASGVNALANNNTGSFNSGFGIAALRDTTSGLLNVAMGYGAGANATTGSNNIYLGAQVGGVAGESNTMYLGRFGTQTKTMIAGVRGTLVLGGQVVLIDPSGQLGSASTVPGNTVGSLEVINDSLTAADLGPDSVGTSELTSNSVTADKVAFNYAASASEGGAAANLACAGCVNASEVDFDFATLSANTFQGTQTFSGNINFLAPASVGITRGGQRFLHNFNQGTFLGVLAGNFTMTGNSNTGVGGSALAANTTGQNNAALGGQALNANTSGDSNTAVGTAALFASSLGSDNVAVGYFALGRAIAGFDNVAIGYQAGASQTAGSNNIYLGANVAGVDGEIATMYLGKVGAQVRTFISGVRGLATGLGNAVGVLIDSNGQLGTINSSRRFKEDIRDMADASRRLYQLRPVTFRYKKPYTDGSKPIHFGLIAEEVAEVFPELAARGADGEIETVHYETLNVLLLNELQAQQRRIEKLEQQLEALLRASTQNQ